MQDAPSGASDRGDDGCKMGMAPTSDAWLHEVTFIGRKPPADADEWPFLVILQLSGTTIAVQGPAPVLLRPGDLALVEGGSADWTSAGTECCRQLRLPLPSASIPPRLSCGTRPRVRLLAGDDGLRALLAHLLNGLRNEEKSLDTRARAAVSAAIASLIAVALTQCRTGVDGAVPAPRLAPAAARARWLALCAFVEARLREPGLCPDHVARSNGISTRHLHRLFQQAGTSFGSFVRDLRLARCRADLGDKRCADLSVTAIAFHWGFSDSTHFSRSFKAAYGVTARAYRQRSLPGSPQPKASQFHPAAPTTHDSAASSRAPGR